VVNVDAKQLLEEYRTDAEKEREGRLENFVSSLGSFEGIEEIRT
jgi:hypothetical protein